MKSKRDQYGGALMFALGVGAVLQGATYHIGTLSQMGPGFFPTSLGVVLAGTGIAIAASARRSERQSREKRRPAQLRAWALISLSIVAFLVLGKYGGLVPATFAIVFIAALADRQNSAKTALLLSITIVAICVVVFSLALQLQFPLFTWDGR